MLAKLVLNSAAFQIQLLLSPQLTSGSALSTAENISHQPEQIVIAVVR